MLLVGITNAKIITTYLPWDAKENQNTPQCEISLDTENLNVKYSCINVILEDIRFLDKNGFTVGAVYDVNQSEGYTNALNLNGSPVTISATATKTFVECYEGFINLDDICVSENYIQELKQERLKEEHLYKIEQEKLKQYNYEVELEKQKKLQHDLDLYYSRLQKENEIQRDQENKKELARQEYEENKKREQLKLNEEIERNRKWKEKEEQTKDTIVKASSIIVSTLFIAIAFTVTILGTAN